MVQLSNVVTAREAVARATRRFNSCGHQNPGHLRRATAGEAIAPSLGGQEVLPMRGDGPQDRRGSCAMRFNLALVFVLRGLITSASAQFESFRDPVLIIQRALPMTGAIDALYFTEHSERLFADRVVTLIGLISKHGITCDLPNGCRKRSQRLTPS